MIRYELAQNSFTAFRASPAGRLWHVFCFPYHTNLGIPTYILILKLKIVFHSKQQVIVHIRKIDAEGAWDD